MNIPEIFGSDVFNESVMKEVLEDKTYKALKKTIHDGAPLDLALAKAVAHAMKVWAISKGATHYTHWFQPMTGITAEKHDSFITPSDEGHVIMSFSGKELIKGESDASSFPSGGIRDTYEARGYTAWDPTSYPFVKDGTLCIPTAFCSYTGESLDKKTPLLRSMDAINIQALRVLRLFGNTDAIKITPTVGPEQEYFLIDEEKYARRKDLIFTGRTLFGTKPPKGQDLGDHYFGALKPKVSAFMADLDRTLWKLGVLAKTEHNEAAPAQHELAPIFDTTNISADHNQLTMEMMKKVAKNHGLTCLLHEKPFEGVNGSGKHNNWSLSTDTGVNLFDPGSTPSENAQFLLFLAAVIKAVDDHQDLMRVSVASAGNDHRLGAHEAPPAIVSIFLGDDLDAIFDALVHDREYVSDGKKHKMDLGVDILPKFPMDNTDRNRTSPFAFTGNKFEFRMLGSTASVADPNIVLNTIVADVLGQFADELEKADDFYKALADLVKRTFKEHSRIIFNGNGYSEEWEREAEKRGLLNLKTTVDAMPYFISEKSIGVFSRQNVYSETEVKSRYEINLETYSNMLHIEALTMLDMAKKEYIPAISAYTGELADTILAKRSVSKSINCDAEEDILKKLSDNLKDIYSAVTKLSEDVKKAESIAGNYEKARFYCDIIREDMENLRKPVDMSEEICADDYWPVPNYGDMLYKV